jgi:hypothetical protein
MSSIINRNNEQDESVFTSLQFYFKILLSTLSLMLVFSLESFSQSYNLDQGENGGVTAGVLQRKDTVQFQNGNLGKSNAHFNESHSVPYRVHLYNLTGNTTYVIRIGFDVRVGSKYALDYITGPQNLSPHGFFPHAEEHVLPLLNPSKPGIPTNTAPAFFTIPDITYGTTGQRDTLRASFNNLEAQTITNPSAVGTKKQLVIYNAVITSAVWQAPAPGVNLKSLATVEAVLMIKFTTDPGKTEAMLAWGGHIASQIDWGINESASYINGSPYHTRIKGFAGDPGNGSKDFTEDGGSSDRSLKTDAVYVAPPSCPTIPKQYACPEDANGITYTVPAQTGVTFNWAINAGNTAGATLQNTTGTSVTVIPSGAKFSPGGTFTLTLTLVKSGTPNVVCTYTGVGEIINVSVSGVANPTTINLVTGNTSTLTATPSGGVSPYDYAWTELNPFGGDNISLTNATTNSATFTVNSAAGVQSSYDFQILVTDDSGCVAKDTVTVAITGSAPPCAVTGASPVCPESTNNYIYNPDGTGGADALPANFTAVWKLVNANGATLVGTNGTNTIGVKAGSGCNTTFTIRIVLTSTSGLIKDSCEKTVTVIDETKPVLSGCPSNVTVDFCNIPAPANVTATDNCPSTGTQVLVEFFETRTNGSNGCSNVITRKWRATDACGNKDSCMQTITIQDQDDPLITCPPAVTIKCADDRNDFTKTGYPFTSDNCGIASVTKSDNPASPACGTTFVRTWTVTDNAGRTASCTQNITILAAPAARLATENITSTSTSSETTATITTNKFPVTKSKLDKTVVVPTSTGLQVNAYPNPFSRMVNFSFVSSKSGRALLEVYNALGQKVGVAFEGWLDAGVQKTVRYTIPLSVSAPIIYRLQVGDKSAVEKLLRQ